MTREEWLRHAVELLDTHVFDGDLDILNVGFQISCSGCPGKKLTTTIQPYDGEDARLEDFFPKAITVSHSIKDPMEMLANLARECIFAFFNEKNINKRVKRLMTKYQFEQPYSGCYPSDLLKSRLELVLSLLEKQCGKFPGETVIIRPKEKKDAKKNTLIMFCPSCGYEIKVSRKMFEQHGQACPTCVCGAKMSLDDGETEETI